jgi:hypothetical protein
MQCKVTDVLFSRLGRNFAERFGMHAKASTIIGHHIVANDSPRLGAWLVKLRPCARAWCTSSDARVLRKVDVCGNLTNALDCDGSADFDVSTIVFYRDRSVAACLKLADL